MDYEKKYKEALEKASHIKDNNTIATPQEVAEYIFPVLKKSEDEKVRKDMLNYCYKRMNNEFLSITIHQVERWMAWLEKQTSNVDNANKEYWRGYREGKQEILDKYAELEKQGEHQKFLDSIQVGDKVTRNEDGVLVNLSQLNRVAKIEEPTYTKKDVDDAYLKGLEDAKSTEINEDPCKDCDQRVKNCQNFPCYRKKAFDEQKPVWSDEDEELYREALVAFASLYNEVDPVVDWGKLYSWFKSLKGKIQPKQEWSEEDSVRLQRIIDFLWHNRKGDTDTIYQQEQDIDWLKSLRPQNRCAYNPYKAVVDSIAEMCKHYDKANHSGLRDFYDNVKVKCKDAKEYDSLYPQNTWKPSDEQMEAVKCAALDVKNYSLRSEQLELENEPYYKALTSLYNELKKLKG